MYYLLVFVAAFLVDLLPFFGPPAWTAMVFLQVHYGLNIWWVLVTGVVGSTLGRYVLSLYIPWLSTKIITVNKNKDLQFIGEKLSGNGWQIQLFVLLYTLMPLPSTPLFTVAGIARIKPMHIIPAFFVGKFTSDMMMVFTGHYVVNNARMIAQGFLTWQNILSTCLGIILICVFLFIDWRVLIQHKRLTLNFHIWAF